MRLFAGSCVLSFLFRFGEWFGRNWSWLRWVLAVAVLAFLFYQHREGIQTIQWSDIHWGSFGLGVLCCLCALLLTYVRWFLLVWAQEIPFRLQDALRLGFIGYLFNYVAPGAVGGDLIKASMIARAQTEKRFIAVATVFLDRVVGLIGLLGLGGVLMLWPTPVLENPEFLVFVGIFQIGAVVSIVGMGVVMLPGLSRIAFFNRLVQLNRVGPIFGELINSFRLYQSRWYILVIAVLMSFVSHAVLIFSFYFCALALHGANGIPSLIEHFQIIPPAELAGVLVPLPGGVGALEGAVEVCYQFASAPENAGFLTAIAYRLVTILVAIVGVVWYMFARREIEEALHPETSPENPDESVSSPLQ